MIKNGIVSKEVVKQANFTGVQYGFFNNIGSNEGYLSEDYSFCQRVRQAGFDIHAYAGPGITHTGSMTFHS